METNNIVEKELRPKSGMGMLLLLIVGMALCTVGFVLACIRVSGGYFYYRWELALLVVLMATLAILGWIVCPILLAGLKIVRPNEARVLTLFGQYYGTIKRSGFFYVNPFCTTFNPNYTAAVAEANAKQEESLKRGSLTVTRVGTGKNISLKTQTLDNRRQKVNDVLGNPIIVGAVVIWRVVDATRAVFAVENYAEYLSIQADSTVRNIARLYPYDVFSEDGDLDGDGVPEKTLRGSAMEIADSMRVELQKRVASAGLEIEEVRITHLAYAEEIAAAMLQRQQAVAIIAARQKIVDGAVGMVKMALDKLGEEEVVVLDEERKAAMVSNLLVILCGNKDAQPILNSGSLY